MPAEVPPGFEALPGIRAAFLGRVPGIDAGRDDARARLGAVHREWADHEGFAGLPFATAGQVHGNAVAVVDADTRFPVADTDGLVTGSRAICLAVAVADCAAVYLADRRGRGIALVHSGRKGTELGIARLGVRLLCGRFGCAPGDLVAALSPCIRPPHYEIDFAQAILGQLAEEGVGEIHAPVACTASHPDRYYSYRREMGRTGRMLALLALQG